MTELTVDLVEDHAPQTERPLGSYLDARRHVHRPLRNDARRGGALRPPARARSDQRRRAARGRDVQAQPLVAKEKVTSFLRAPFTEFQESSGHGEVEEKPQGHGLRLAVGELLVCPYCLGLWVAGGFAAGMVVAPRSTRLVASVFATKAVSDFLQLAYKAAEDAPSPPDPPRYRSRTANEGEHMAGEIVHIEFPSTDVDRAQRFWGGLFGWEFGDTAMPDFDYRMAQTGGSQASPSSRRRSALPGTRATTLPPTTSTRPGRR